MFNWILRCSYNYPVSPRINHNQVRKIHEDSPEAFQKGSHRNLIMIGLKLRRGVTGRYDALDRVNIQSQEIQKLNLATSRHDKSPRTLRWHPVAKSPRLNGDRSRQRRLLEASRRFTKHIEMSMSFCAGHKSEARRWQSIRAPFRLHLTRISFTNHPLPRAIRRGKSRGFDRALPLKSRAMLWIFVEELELMEVISLKGRKRERNWSSVYFHFGSVAFAKSEEEDRDIREMYTRRDIVYFHSTRQSSLFSHLWWTIPS